ncbi:MAG TPA: YoaK family protein [Flavobacterium sp.]|uniref:YoaK family protein n=1 Tax=Flavobacterium sp. TaxID=239 RepID=UPI002C15DD16|nr:YoaK family protein [Flavobacterium sp.]HNP32903.1 YoaK family protein [Flavobacterium sp.]
MFVHQGKKRTSKHNLQIASLLSFVAGIVNVAGFLAVAKLTTNVTGHFAFFVDEIFKLNFWQSFIYFLYIFFFFLGSFTSSFIVEIITRKNENFVYIVPTSIESIILSLIAVFGKHLILENPNLIACSLLFAMGLQNSLVTRISNATVRTTHLTGLFTDLGIELSQLFFYRGKESSEKLLSSIKLRLTIISFFFIGGIIGGIFYSKIGLLVLLIGSISLALGIVFDNIRLRIKWLQRKYRH